MECEDASIVKPRGLNVTISNLKTKYAIFKGLVSVTEVGTSDFIIFVPPPDVSTMPKI